MSIQRTPPRADAIGFGLGFAVLAALAVAVGTALPVPSPPRTLRIVDAPRTPVMPDHAVASRQIPTRPADIAALSRLVEQLRREQRPLPLAVALERLYAATQDPAPLREAMGLRLELGDTTAARAGLERLAMLGAATEAELIRLAELRLQAGDPANATAFLLRHLPQYPTEALALATASAAQRLPNPSAPMRALGAGLAELNPAALEPLRRALMAEARPDMALALIEGLPADMQADPVTSFRMAEAEARIGFPGAGLARLLALRATEGLPVGAGALLIDLALREGRLADAFEVAGQLPAESWPGPLPMRLHEAARAAARPELFRQIDPQRLAARPDAAAVVALARGDRVAARRYAAAALDRPPASSEGARGVAAVLRDLGQDQAAWERLRREIDAPRANPAAVRLFAELSALPARAASALPLLERLRNDSPLAGEAWLRLALVQGQNDAAAAFLRAGGPSTSAALVETLQMAASRRDGNLASAAALALRGRAILPDGWSVEEIGITAALARPLAPGTLGAALDLLAGTAEAESRNRIVLALAGAPEIGGAAAALEDVARHPAIARLRQEAESATGETAIARLALLAVLAPREALPLLARRAA